MTTMVKLHLVHSKLSEGKDVMYIDSDIVILKDFEEEIAKNIREMNVHQYGIFQDDRKESHGPNNLCTGFMWIK